jgi:HEAT repeat protein/cyclophilin family peptidyl-prolyl cis-trans isomerase
VKKILALLLVPTLASAAPPPLSTREKMTAVLRDEDRRSAAGLGELLRDDDASVRRRATLAAGRIDDPSLTLAVADRLSDPIPEVRRMAAFALGLIGDAKTEARLEAALKDSDSVVRARAAEALGRLGDPRAAAAVARMVIGAVPKGVAPLAVRGDDAGNPNDPWLELRLGLFALAALKDVPSASSALVESGRSRFDWWAATWVASTMAAPDLQPVLTAAASSTDRWSRALAADGLARARDPQAVALLGKLVQDRDETVAARAVRALGATGDASAVAAVEPLLRTTGPFGARVKLAALQALALLPPSRKSRDDVVALVGHEEPEIRGAAMRVLARLDPAELALVLSGSGRDPVWSVRAGLATGLAGGHDELSLGLLYSLLRDDDARVVAAALDALRVSLGPESRLTLVQQLGHTDLGVRTAAARGLEALGDTADTAELAAAYRRSMDDREPEARLAIVSALAVTHRAEANETLAIAARDDPARAVRAMAARALVVAGQSAPALEPEGARATLDYAIAMAPYDPQPGVRVYTPRVFLHTRRGTVEIHLNTLEAPLACDSFVTLARRGFFNGLEFHRVVPGVRVESGCPRGDGLGGPGYRLRREAGLRPFGRGSVGLEAPAKDAEGSRFFVTLAPDPEDDGRATLVGTVVNGLEVLDALRAQDTIEDVEVWD